MSDEQKPKVAGLKPVVVELEAGNYSWCSCGLSQNQPFCDGAHKGSEFRPIKFTLEEKKKVALCTCKTSKSSPFCDGTHKGLVAE